MSEIQSIYFIGWNAKDARDWLKKNNYKPIKKAHKKGTELRYRLKDPDLYKSFVTNKHDNGIYFVLGLK